MNNNMDLTGGDVIGVPTAHQHQDAHDVMTNNKNDETPDTTADEERMKSASTPAAAVAIAVDNSSAAAAAAASRKRPPSKQFSDEYLPAAGQRPRMTTTTESGTAAAAHAEAHGLLDFALQNNHRQHQQQHQQQQQQHQPNNNYLHSFLPPQTAQNTNMSSPPQSQNNNVLSQLHKSVVHLSIVKCKPSFTEPWRKLPPVSLVGSGLVIPWKDNGGESSEKITNMTSNDGGREGTASAAAASPAMASKPPPPPPMHTHSEKDHIHQTQTNQNDNCTNDNTGKNSSATTFIRILTLAHSVQHATSIRARTQHSPISFGCIVEWISPAMDLALLKIDYDVGVPKIQLDALLPHIAMELPQLGEELTCLSFPKVGIADMSAPPPSLSVHQTSFGRLHNPSTHGSWMSMSSRHVDLNMNRGGSVVGYYAEEDAHYMLRMKMNLSTMASSSFGDNRRQSSSLGGGGGGLVVNVNGNVVGMIASSSRMETMGFHSVIPGLVMHNFLSLCKQTKKCGGSTHNHLHAPSATATATCNNTDGECSASASRYTSDDTFHSDKGSQVPHHHSKGTGPNKSGIKRLPGIPTLGITGFQTLENRALRRTLGLGELGDGFLADDNCGVRILGINHTVHPSNDSEYQSQLCKEDRKCHTSMLRTDDVLLAVNDVPVRLDGTVPLTPSGRRDNERIDFRWLISQRSVGSTIKLDVMRQQKRMQLHATLSAPRHLVPKCDEGEGTMPSYVTCGGCVFVPLTEAWLSETLEKKRAIAEQFGLGGNELLGELHGFQRYLQEQRKGDQQIIILSHVLADDVNVGYHGMSNMVLTSVNGQRPINNMHHLMEILVKREIGQSLEFRLSYVHLDRAKVAICMDTKEVMDSEQRIMSNYMIDAWCSNALSPSLKKEADGKAHRHGVTCGLRTMRALRNAVRETTLVVRRPTTTTTGADDTDSAVAVTRRIMDFGETHKMQSAPLFAGKYTDEGGWTQVKTKHLSQLCACGKSTRFYCICTVGVMRCKDCFIGHCRDHTNHHECSETCAPNCEGEAEVLVEGVELVTTKKRKRNNPTQAIQSRCVVCKAKTCYCCSACGFEKEVALCHVSTGRNCLPIHTSEHHNTKCSHSH